MAVEEIKLHSDIKSLAALVNVPIKELAVKVLHEHPRTTAGRLNGEMPLTEVQRDKLLAYLNEAKAALAARLANG
jgi:hypothetical protein